MKQKILCIVAVVVTIFSQAGFAQDSVHSKHAQLLTSYYQIKDALVAGNAITGMSAAKEFVTIARGIEEKERQKNTIDALVQDAGSISKTKDIKKQREYFAAFSSNIFTLAKAQSLSDKPVYQQYCPMKKASWLSSTKAIKNPYYGSAMLTCGEVVETITN